MIALPPLPVRTGTTIDIHGLQCVVETPKDVLRTGKTWINKSPAHYGYIEGFVGADGDYIDAYIGTEPSSKIAVVIDQNKLQSLASFDEHKIMLHYGSQRSALRDYFRGHSAGHQIFRAVTVLTIDRLKKWLEEGNLKRPISEQDV